MKKILALLCIGSAACFTVSAQKLKETQVPAAAKSAFMKAHPNMKGEWEMEEGNYEVVYKLSGKTMSSVIDKSGSIVETETDLSANELPKSVQSYISQHHKGAKTKGAAKIVKANGEVNYEANVDGKALMFDNNGNLIKKAKEEKEDEGKEHKGGKKGKG